MNIQESVKNIETYLELDRCPVGVKFFFTEKEYQSFDAPLRDTKITYCNAVQLASRGKGMKLTKEHQGCPNGAMALHMKDIPEPMANGKARFSKNIYKTQDISKSISDEMSFLEKEPFGFAVMPLSDFQEDPDVVIVIGGSYPIMRLIQGHAFYHGYTPNLKTVGLQAVCHDITTYPYNSDDINITFLCPGTRLVANWQMHELGIGIPWSKWYQVVDGVIETTNPFARNGMKKTIVEKMNQIGMDASGIKMNQNYDDGSYSGGKVNH